MIEALSNKEWTFSAILEQVKNLDEDSKDNNSQNLNICVHPNHFEYREKWLKLVKELGIKPARSIDQALYAWLYR
ncbi:transposase, partial [Acinetobacter baumannii]